MLKLINSNSIRKSIQLNTGNYNLNRLFSISSKVLTEAENASNLTNESSNDKKFKRREFRKFDKNEDGRKAKYISNNRYHAKDARKNTDQKRREVKSDFDETSTFKTLKAMEPSVVVLVLDLLDLDNSIPKGLSENLPPNAKLIITANHFDCLKNVDWRKGLRTSIISRLKLCKLDWNGTISLIDTHSGTKINSLKDTINKYNEENGKVTFLGLKSANLHELIDAIHLGNGYETKKLTIPIDGSEKKYINLYTPMESNSENAIKFQSNYLQIKGERPSYFDLLTPAEFKTLVDRESIIAKHNYHNYILPNTTAVFGDLFKLEYQGKNKVFYNNFSNIKPKFYPTFVKKSDVEQGEKEEGEATEGEQLKYNPDIPFVKDMKFQNLIKLPLKLAPNKNSVQYSNQHTSQYISEAKPPRFSFDLGLNGLGWLSFDTKTLEKYETEGALKVYSLQGVKLPISRARLPNWVSYLSREDIEKFKSKGEKVEIDAEVMDQENAINTEASEQISEVKV
jgi:CRISPR/Cas system-associated endonuclease Cas3-HD